MRTTEGPKLIRRVDGRRIDLLSAALVGYIVSVLIFDFTPVYRIALMVMLVAVALFDRSWLREPPSSVTYGYGALFLYFVVHTYSGWSTTPAQSEAKLVTMILTFIGIILVTRVVRTRNAIALVMDTIIVCAFVLSAYVVIVLWDRIFNDLAWLSIPKMFFPDLNYAHNDIPTVLVFAIFFLRYKLLTQRLSGHVQVFFWSAIAFFVSLTVLSGARKALICALFGLVIYPVLVSGQRKALLMKFLKIGLLLVAVYLMSIKVRFLYTAIGYRFEAVIMGLITDDYSSEASTRYRAVLTEVATEQIRQNWIRGYGLDSFGTRTSFGGWTENTYLDLWYAGGILAVIIFLSYFLYVIVRIQLRPRLWKDDLLYQLLAVWMVVNSYITVSYPSRVLYLIPCLISAYVAIADGDEKEGVVARRDFSKAIGDGVPRASSGV